MKKIQKFLIVLAILAIILFIIPYLVAGILNIGNLTGIIVFTILLLYGIKLKEVNNYLKFIKNFTVAKVIIIIISSLVGIILFLTISLSTMMYQAATNNFENGSTLVVLGCGVADDGQPSLMLSERLIAAYNYLIDHPESVAILSGGQGNDEIISEAQCMYDYLITQGIANKRLYMEDEATSTRENLLFSKQIIDDNNLDQNIIIVTNEFHQYRAKLVAGSLDLSVSAASAKTAWWLFPTYYVRELYGILYQLVF